MDKDNINFSVQKNNLECYFALAHFQKESIEKVANFDIKNIQKCIIDTHYRFILINDIHLLFEEPGEDGSLLDSFALKLREANFISSFKGVGIHPVGIPCLATVFYNPEATITCSRIGVRIARLVATLNGKVDDKLFCFRKAGMAREVLPYDDYISLMKNDIKKLPKLKKRSSKFKYIIEDLENMTDEDKLLIELTKNEEDYEY